MWYLGPNDYMVNTQNNYLQTGNLLHQQSSEDADLFIKLFGQAIEQGLNPNDADLQEEIFSQGNLGGWDQLMPFDQERITKFVERKFNSRY